MFATLAAAFILANQSAGYPVQVVRKTPSEVEAVIWHSLTVILDKNRGRLEFFSPQGESINHIDDIKSLRLREQNLWIVRKDGQVQQVINSSTTESTPEPEELIQWQDGERGLKIPLVKNRDGEMAQIPIPLNFRFSNSPVDELNRLESRALVDAVTLTHSNGYLIGSLRGQRVGGKDGSHPFLWDSHQLKWLPEVSENDYPYLTSEAPSFYQPTMANQKGTIVGICSSSHPWKVLGFMDDIFPIIWTGGKAAILAGPKEFENGTTRTTLCGPLIDAAGRVLWTLDVRDQETGDRQHIFCLYQGGKTINLSQVLGLKGDPKSIFLAANGDALLITNEASETAVRRISLGS